MKNTSLKKSFTVIILLFLSGVPLISASQVTLEWAKVFNHKFEDRPASIALGANGNIYVAGRSQDDLVVICYSPDGDSLAFGAASTGGALAGGALVVDDSNYVYVTGSDYVGWPTYYQAETIKFDPFEQLPGFWKQSINESSYGNAITLDDSSNVYVTGVIHGLEMFTIKYNRYGLSQWFKITGFGYYDAGIDIEVDNDMHAYVLAQSKNSSSYSEFLLVKYDNDGDTLWTARYNEYGYDNIPVCLKLDKAGNIYVSGTVYKNNDERDNFTTLKYDPYGNLKWVATYNGPASYTDQVTDMCIDDSANVYVTGIISATTQELAVVKYDSSGNQKWVGRFAGSGQYGIVSTGQICADESGNVYATGSVSYNNDENITTLKFDRNGQLIWNIEYACTDLVWDRPAGLVADCLGNIYVLGNSASITPGNSYDWVTLKYSQTDYRIDLSVFLEGPFNGTDMNANLAGLPDFPLAQPFNTAPWNYAGTESVLSVPNADVVDWVLVEMRDAPDAASANPSTRIARQAAFLLSNGQIVGMDGISALPFYNSINQQLFVVIWHLNHLGVMSAFPLSLVGGVYTYDFTTGETQAYGGINGHKLLAEGKWGMYAGDGNADNTINLADKTGVWMPNAGKKGFLSADFKRNGQVTNRDKNDFWLFNLSKSCQVPQ